VKNLDVIINGCRVNDPKQQKLLFEHYYGFALSIALKYQNEHEEARLIVNDSFVKLFRNINRFVYVSNSQIEAQLMAWLKKIVVNTAIDKLRRTNRQFESLQDKADTLGDADHSLLYKDLVRQVKALPRSYGAVFSLHVIDGFKHCEIAQQLGISIGTSKSNLSKAKSYLRKLIKSEAAFSLS
jgi:RNA polymerase sigma factor (sigma-70 family)